VGSNNGGLNGKLDRVWQHYDRTHSRDDEEALCKNYRGVVVNIAVKFGKVISLLDLDDLIGYGTEGLLGSVREYDLTRGVKFETFAAQRIKGAIRDGLRNSDSLHRYQRIGNTKYNQAANRIIAKKGADHKVTIVEVLKILESDGCAKETLMAVKNYGERNLEFVSLEVYLGENVPPMNDYDRRQDANSRYDAMIDRRSDLGHDKIRRKDVLDYVSKGLSREERLILVLYYYEELTLKEIGIVLDLSESRISQIHSTILEGLRSSLGRQPRKTLDNLGVLV